ncbi:hypothetical protein FOQG_15841 [Fusarium oxysporum f. sp. raphani 54005]|uniref:Uncharacterized protein n=2 Tax=Fusarium oxysporum TaxID=5507 RepID=X0BCT6_FUSOX|nr:hypothetical protein FOVG_16948 [Fusarium oxysporum f. sp. pisi HDV247]EXK79601.1 hypothetical protein FOQG_15841 [Fusarium oxysporum f. sp. raphani 54005]
MSTMWSSDVLGASPSRTTSMHIFASDRLRYYRRQIY